jgi:ribosomal peptide maturation radical SAM protein 1
MKRKIRTLLVSPPWADYKNPNLSIGAIASYLRKYGFDAEALHMHIEAAAYFGLDDYEYISDPEKAGEALCAAMIFPQKKKALIRYFGKKADEAESYAKRTEKLFKTLYSNVKWSKYDLIGFTTNFLQSFPSLLLAAWIKRDHSNIRIVLGGRLVTLDIGKFIIKHFDQIDWCIDGEGEEALASLISAIQEGKSSFESEIPGLIFRDKDSVQNNPKKKMASLRNLPDPDYDHYFHILKNHPTFKQNNIKTFIPIEGSRGCNNRCAFCSDHLFWGNNRQRPAQETADSIRRMTTRYGINSVLLTDLAIRPAQCDELFPLIASHGNDYRISCFIRANLSKDQFSKLKNAGVCSTFMGLEALDSKLLKIMWKGTRLIDNLESMKHSEATGILNSTNLILGFPGETQSDIDRSIKSIDYAWGFTPVYRAILFNLLEGSPVYLYPHKFGVTSISHDVGFYRFLPKPVSDDARMCYKDFISKGKPRHYKALNDKLAKWRSSYYKHKTLKGQPMLSYYNCEDYMLIEDYRHGFDRYTFKGWQRDVYIFCDSTKRWDEIIRRFDFLDESQLKRFLNKLFRLKLLFTENNLYLSLAIHWPNNNRQYTLFV